MIEQIAIGIINSPPSFNNSKRDNSATLVASWLA
jgi:hypothetical protein